MKARDMTIAWGYGIEIVVQSKETMTVSQEAEDNLVAPLLKVTKSKKKIRIFVNSQGHNS
jgi:hypothetical protein